LAKPEEGSPVPPAGRTRVDVEEEGGLGIRHPFEGTHDEEVTIVRG
jgi:hypothetical protein